MKRKERAQKRTHRYGQKTASNFPQSTVTVQRFSRAARSGIQRDGQYMSAGGRGCVLCSVLELYYYYYYYSFRRRLKNKPNRNGIIILGLLWWKRFDNAGKGVCCVVLGRVIYSHQRLQGLIWMGSSVYGLSSALRNSREPD